MPRHRLATGADYYRLPAPRPATMKPGSFQLMPTSLVECTPEQLEAIAEIYRIAFERACDAARRGRFDDVLFSNWN